MKVSTDDLLLAYRQAKASLYFERRGVGLLEFARFEESLASNLRRLQRQLISGNGWFDGIAPGAAWAVPKRVRNDLSGAVKQDVTIIGGSICDKANAGLEVQMRVSPTPWFAIMEIMYLWRFGPALNRLLSKEAVGYRLDLRDDRIRKDGRWVFEYWPKRYNEFRTTPIKAAREAIEKLSGPVDVLSADLASFYDTVDPSFLLQDDFIDQILGDSGNGTLSFAREYKKATKSLLNAYSIFRNGVESVTGKGCPIGVPIGALTSRLVANVALAPLDKTILKNKSIICYRRYVDDFVIVGQPGNNDLASLDAMMRHYVPQSAPNNSEFILDASKLGRRGSTFRLQRSKCRAHRLEGQAGLDFLEAIAADFSQLVSEHRAFMDTSVFDPRQARRIVRAGKDIGATVRSLRDADRTKLEHFALSTALSSLERLSTLVENGDARRLVRSALAGMDRHVAAPDNWVESVEAAFRLLKIAVGIEDWIAVRNLIGRMDRLWGTVKSLKQCVSGLYLRDSAVEGERPWVCLRNYLHERRLEAICGSIGPSKTLGALPTVLQEGILHRNRRLGARALMNRARQLAAADLRAFDREDDVQLRGAGDFQNQSFRNGLTVGRHLTERLKLIQSFVERCEKLGDMAWSIDPMRLFLSTRPPSYFDIARRWLYDVETKGFGDKVFENLIEVVNAIRGTYYTDPVGVVSPDDEKEVRVPISELDGSITLEEQESPRLILGNLVVKISAFNAAAAKAPLLSAERLLGVAEVLARATSIARGAKKKQKSLLVLPELSLPRRWFREVANYVARYGKYGLVVGLEYQHHAIKSYVYNQVYAVFPGPFAAVATWPWTKRFPAREEAVLLEPHRVTFAPHAPLANRRVVVHSPYGRLSVLICSELIEAHRVADLVGRVELVVVPSWNTDTASYDHLIQSAGLQLHSIIAIANNGEYSDCRVWAPRSERWERDLCRLIERGDDDVVCVDIPLASLRDFHSLNNKQQSSAKLKTKRRKAAKSSPKPAWRPLPPDWPTIP